jgi:hypothetical protein
MQNVINFDVLISCTIALFCYAFVARERSKASFVENRYRINLRVEELSIALKIVSNNWKLLLIIPFISMAFAGYAQLSTTLSYIRYIYQDNESVLHLAISISNIKELLLYVYRNADSLFARSISFFSQYLIIGIFGNALLLFYVFKRRDLFSKTIIIEVVILQIIQLFYIGTLIIVFNAQFYNRVLIGVAILAEILVMSFSMAVVVGVIIKIILYGSTEKRSKSGKMDFSN